MGLSEGVTFLLWYCVTSGGWCVGSRLLVYPLAPLSLSPPAPDPPDSPMPPPESQKKVVPHCADGLDTPLRTPLWRRGLVSPNAGWKLRWDALMCCFALYYTLVIPCVRRRGAGDSCAHALTHSWLVGYTFDSLERVCTGPQPLDNCYPRHMAGVDTFVNVCFWRAPALGQSRTHVLTSPRTQAGRGPVSAHRPARARRRAGD